jgi:hypothetical protein
MHQQINMRIIPAIIVAVVGMLVAVFLFPGDKILVVSNDPKLAKRFALATAQKSNAQLDILCLNECTLFESVSFNCDGKKSVLASMLACVLHRYNLLKLHTYNNVYMVESGSVARLDRSPFYDYVYKYVNYEFRRDRTAKVTVVLTDVTCEGMREYMKQSRTMEEECNESPAGRNATFYRFFLKLASQGNLAKDHKYMDFDA